MRERQREGRGEGREEGRVEMKVKEVEDAELGKKACVVVGRKRSMRRRI